MITEETGMQNMLKWIRQTLSQEYGIEVCDICRMTTGVGGDTFLVNAHQGRFVYKIADMNGMNRGICQALLQCSCTDSI